VIHTDDERWHLSEQSDAPPTPHEADEDQAARPEELRAEIWRGQLLDRELAVELGRPEPSRTAGASGFVESLSQRPILPQATERALVLKAKDGDTTAKAHLVEAFMPLISSVARAYRSGHVSRLELLQEGVVGLLRAVEGFDPDRGTPFWAYASWWVRQAMQQLVSELTRPVVLSDRALRHLARMRDAQRDSMQQNGREATAAELAERTGLTGEQVDNLLATERSPRSLDEPIPGEEGAVGTFGDLLVDPLAEDEYERVLARIEVDELHTMLAGLSDRERSVLRARYGLDGPEQTLRDVGGHMGLSGERVRQIERRALGKLASAVGVE
jgi:RNA polymerase sigma factor (sigma-70 family)